MLVRYPAERLAAEFFSIDNRPLRQSLSELADDPLERHLLSALKRELAASGTFARPLLVDFSSFCLRDGHHRAAVALDERALLWVTDVEPEVAVELELSCRLVLAPGANTRYDVFDLAFAFLRSFPVPGGWAQSDVCSLRHGCEFHGTYQLDDPGCLTELAAQFVVRAATADLLVSDLAIVPAPPSGL